MTKITYTNSQKSIKKIAAQIKRKRTVKLAQVASKAYNQHRKGDTDGMAATIIDSFIELGGVYVKFLQGVLLQSSKLKSSKNANKLRIFENLDSEPMDISRYLQYHLGPTKLKQITSINPIPFAAGSFGQVYYGIHADGTAIIIKIMRPLIRETLRYDLKLIGIFTRRFIKKGYTNMDIDLKQAYEEFRQATLRETNYVEEANFAHELYEHYKDNPKLIIPKTYLDLCTPSLIVQEYIDGISAAQLLTLKDQGVDPKQYIHEQLGSDIDEQLITVGYEYMYGVYTLDRMQGDPHPGNIRFMTNNRVGIIDFGISARTPKEKAAFLELLHEYGKLYKGQQDVANMFNQFLRFFVSDLYTALKKLNTMLPKKPSDEDFTKIVGKIAEQAFTSELGDKATLTSLLKDANETQLMMTINKLVNKDNRFGLVMKLETSEFTRAMSTYMSLVGSLDRRSQVLQSVFSRSVTAIERDFSEVVDDPLSEKSISQALEIISNWLERIALRDPQLFKQLMNRIRIGDTIKKVKEIPNA